MRVRGVIFLGLLGLPGAALAQASVCAGLPEAGLVGERVADVRVVPVPRGDRGVQCPDGFKLTTNDRMPMCTGPGVKAVDGKPRAMCYGALPLGPIADLPAFNRPTRTCPKAPTVSIVRLEGANVGMSDAVVSVAPDDGITVKTLSDATTAEVAENPVVQGCFGFSCRLVQLTIEAKARPEVRLRVAWPASVPEREAVETLLKLPEYCPR